MTRGTQVNRIYLDHGATTPVHPAVVAAMTPYWSDLYGNPSSHHRTGYAASRAVEDARETFAALLGVNPAAIVFTACGSESNNLALRGAMFAARAAGRGNHLITSAIEHSAVLATAEQLRDFFGFELTVMSTQFTFLALYFVVQVAISLQNFGPARVTFPEAAIAGDTG